MKKIISLFAGLLFALSIVLADVNVGDRITTYDDGNQIVGERGYVDVSDWNYVADVFVCATREGEVREYGMNLQNGVQKSRGMALVAELAEKSFAQFSHYGCLRAKI